ncbi:peptide/nickel transport system permease protein [Thermomonospora echinospora]|uniref:Peptide/nickel transport system permease protein n=1 Tax=Thermomonospora echinospora TaxID=1992 RepID=A0A1H6BK59_9ACTN|nr:ABC transporter permease [Thermomonospora echinospora]SEG61063.1 peptide/nickel transport system permease protein [Thermomonospora echinospora]
MAGFLVRRLLNYGVLVVLAASLAYLLAAATLRPRAEFAERSPRPPAAVVDAQLTALNLNDKTPLARRYATWASGVLHGDLGRTLNGDPVAPELLRRALVSVRLLLVGTVLGGVLGVLAGAYAAVRQYRPSDRLITVGSFVVLSTPVFVLAVLLQLGAERVNQATGVRIFEWVGEYTPGHGAGPLARLGGRLQHLVLPTLAIVLTQVAVVSRYQRHLMLDVLGADYVRTAMARGLTRRRALLRHGLRTALAPVTTYFAYTFGFVLLGAMFTEKIFGWHGMGGWLIDSVHRGDVNAVAAVNLLAAVLVLLAGLAADAAHGLLDPRVRTGR